MSNLLAATYVGIVCLTHEVIVSSNESQPHEEYFRHWPPKIKFTS